MSTLEAAGECVALVGANGSGKSTAVRAIAGLLEPSAGTVLVTALAGDPSGGGIAMISWLTWWPSAAALVTTALLALAESGAAFPAVIGAIATAAILTWLASRDLDTKAT